jgi:hypothetical protein
VAAIGGLLVVSAGLVLASWLGISGWIGIVAVASVFGSVAGTTGILRNRG